MKLTEKQAEAAAHREGSLLVLAGAGSGKTATMCQRGVLMLDEGLKPEQHLMVTFSRKAAREMAERMRRLAGDPARVKGMHILTFHALGVKLIREHARLHGRGATPTIIDERDQEKLALTAANKAGFDPDRLKGEILGWFGTYSLAKNEGLRAGADTLRNDLVARFMQQRARLKDGQLQRVVKAFAYYEDYLYRNRALDFDDLILMPVEMMRLEPALSERLAARYPFITIDEAQDTNKVQYDLIHLIGRHHGNITMVGDDDQSIYGWRGARVENINQFIADYAPKQIKLEENFRSTRAIVDAAAQHIRNNDSRLEKNPYSSGDHGTPPEYVAHETGDDMALRIAYDIAAKMRAGARPKDFAILYRVNAMAGILEPALARARIPYRLVGSRSMFDRKEILAASAVGRLLTNGHDTQAFLRLSEYIQGLGKKGAMDIAQTALDKEVEVWTAAERAPNRARQAVATLRGKLDELRVLGPHHLAAWMVDRDGLDMLAKEKEKDPEQAEKREEMLGIFQGMIQETIEAHLEAEEDPWQAVLEIHISQPDDLGDEDAVTLTTGHRAKGLEWKHVHIAGYSEKLIPYEHPDGSDPQEERRLSYVMITRGAESVTLHHARYLRFPHRQPMTMEPSRYIRELGLSMPAPRARQRLRYA